MKNKIIVPMILTAMAVAFFATQDTQAVQRSQEAKVTLISANVNYAHVQEPGQDVETVPWFTWCEPKKGLEGSAIHIQKITKTLPNGLVTTYFDSDSTRHAICQ